MLFLQPDKYFSRLSRVDIQRDLLSCGLRFVLLDIDNTILTRDTREVPSDVRAWFDAAQRAGVGLCLLSNNWHETPFRVASELSLPLVAKAMKPLPRGFARAREKLGAAASETVAIGDQLSTDILGAHAAGLKAYLVEPLVEQDLAHTVVIRKIERKIVGNRPYDD